jgi:cytochrome c551
MKRLAWLLCGLGLLVAGCRRPADMPGGLERLDEGVRVRYLQYLDAGRNLYTIHCSNCHQPDGSGLRKLYPPLRQSVYLERYPERAICSMRYGLRGPGEDNAESYPQEMPGNPQLSDLEIAEIATYVYYEFADSVVVWSTAGVAKILADCASP